MVGNFSRFVWLDFEMGTECNSVLSNLGDFAYPSDRVVKLSMQEKAMLRIIRHLQIKN